MLAEIICIGDELLIGQVLDSNSKWMAGELNKIGVSVYQITAIQDDREHILKAIDHAQKNADIVLLTGGLGPTKDDITKEAITHYFKDTLVFHKETAARIKAMFLKINYPYTAINELQAMVPAKCLVLKNEWGTAPGMWFHKNEKVVVVMPGVPNEMKGLMSNSVLPMLKESYQLPYIVHRTILTYGMGESMVAERIESWEKALPPFISLAYLPSYGRVRLRLTAKGDNKDLLEKTLDQEIKKVNDLIGSIIVGYDDGETLEVLIAKLLQEKKQNIGVAESCTGGNIARLLTSVPGASNYFEAGLIAYQASVKISELGVDPSVIQGFSVVSAEVAKAMAMGMQCKYNTSYAIATTGNAGPTTDHTDKTVGTVYIAIASRNSVVVEEYFFGKPRQKVIERASIKALEMLKKEILKN